VEPIRVDIAMVHHSDRDPARLVDIVSIIDPAACDQCLKLRCHPPNNATPRNSAGYCFDILIYASLDFRAVTLGEVWKACQQPRGVLRE
jgi:hypothetical protein